MDCYSDCEDALADAREAARADYRESVLAWIEGHAEYDGEDFGPGMALVAEALRNGALY